MKSFFVAIAVAALCAAAAHAEDRPFYVGAKLGGYTVDDGPVDIDEMAAGAYAGYRFNQYWSVEAEYVHLFEDSVSGVDVDGDLWALTVRPTLPLGESWELFGKLGWGWLDVEAKGFGISASENDDDWVWGVGAAWKSDAFHVRGEILSDSDFPDFYLYTIGIGLDF